MTLGVEVGVGEGVGGGEPVLAGGATLGVPPRADCESDCEGVKEPLSVGAGDCEPLAE